jgi:uncharacterized repeat protein (TIGR01451 family)
LEVTIIGATTATVGSDVRFEIEVANRGQSRATHIVVTDRFDTGLRHAVAASPIERDMVDLPPGAMDRLSLTLRVTEAGQQCQNVTVTADGGLESTARHCLTVVEGPAENTDAAKPQQEATSARAAASSLGPPAAAPMAGPSLSIHLVGPRQEQVGEVARFRIEVTNTSDRPIEALEIADEFETSLQPNQATEGSKWLKGGTLGWKVAALGPGKTVHREIEFKCLRATPRACNRVIVTAVDIEPLSEQASLEIIATGQASTAMTAQSKSPSAAASNTHEIPSDSLSVSVSDTADPIKVGGETTYQVLVTNTGEESVFDVAVTVTFGDELRLMGMGSPVRGTPLAGSVRFEPVREIRAGEAALSYELRMQGTRAGRTRMHVNVTRRGQAKPMSAEQVTEILPAG